MQIQGLSILNIPHFTSLKARLSGAQSCAELQDAINEIMAAVQDEVNGLNKMLGELAPFMDMLNINPTNLTSVINFIKALIKFLTGMIVVPYLTMVAQIAALAAQIAALVAAINDAVAAIEALGIECNITIPTIVMPTLPDIDITAPPFPPPPPPP